MKYTLEMERKRIIYGSLITIAEDGRFIDEGKHELMVELIIEMEESLKKGGIPETDWDPFEGDDEFLYD